MTKDEIMAQLDTLVDAYIEVEHDEGVGDPTTWDFILGTYFGMAQTAFEAVGPECQMVIDEIIQNQHRRN